MRKLTVKVKLNIMAKLGSSLINFYSKIEKMEMEEILKLDLKSGLKVVIIKLTLKEGYNIEDIKKLKMISYLDVLYQEDKTYTVVIKTSIPKRFLGLGKIFDHELIFTKPTILIGDEMTYTCIGGEDNLRKFIRSLKLIGKIKSISYNIADYKGYNLLGFLTEKQKKLLEYAKSRGYYEYPRKINGTQLAKEMKISKPTLIEHLRKIENKIILNINT